MKGNDTSNARAEPNAMAQGACPKYVVDYDVFDVPNNDRSDTKPTELWYFRGLGCRKQAGSFAIFVHLHVACDACRVSDAYVALPRLGEVSAHSSWPLWSARPR